MKPGRRSVPPPAVVPFHPASVALSLPFIVACLIPFVVTFFPDERLVRLKLLGLELGVFLLVTVVGAKLFFESNTGQIRALRPITIISLLFVGIQTLLWWMTPEKSLATVEMRRVALTAASFMAFAAAGFSPAWRRRFLWSWAVCAGLIALYGILQKTNGVGILLVPLFDRPMGTFGNPIFFAAYLLASLFVAAQCFFDAVKPSARFAAAALAACILSALLLTQTRAAWIGLGVAAVIGIVVAVPGKKATAAWLLAFMIAAAAFAAAMHSTWSRNQEHALIWRDTVTMWKSKPMTGVGIGTFHIHFPDYAQADLKAKWPAGTFIVNDAHNEYLQELAEGGVVGFLSWILIPTFFIWSVLARAELRKDNAWLIAGVIGVAAQNFFSVDMRFGVSASLVAQLMGLVLTLPSSPKFSIGDPQPRNGDSRLRHSGMTVPPTDFRKVVLAVFWIFFVGILILPRLLRPYRAYQSVQSTPAFFDQRVLEPAKTIRDLEALAQQYPSEPAVFEKLGFVYAKEIRTADNRLNVEMADKAIAAYEKARSLDPKRPAAYNNLANIQYTIGHVDEAMALWRQAIEQNPHFLDARLNLGKILYTKSQLKEAAEQFDAVLKDDPGNAEATVYLKRMVE